MKGKHRSPEEIVKILEDVTARIVLALPDQQRAADELKVLRQLMERPIRFSTMSGLSGILAGCVTLAGLATDALVCQRWGVGSTTMWVNLCVWTGVFLVALAGTLGVRFG